MAKSKQKDNSTYNQKVLIRQEMLKRMAAAGVEPIIMETHGGYGKLFAACYPDIRRGVVFDTDADKTERLALQRPTWAVYEADCEKALRHGAGAHLCITALDVDAYGDSLTPISCFFQSQRPASRLVSEKLYPGLLFGGHDWLQLWAAATYRHGIMAIGEGDVYPHPPRYTTRCEAPFGGGSPRHTDSGKPLAGCG